MLGPADIARARLLLGQAREAGRCTLDEHESLCVLDAFSIPTVHRRLVTDPDSPEQTVDAADRIGYPVVLKGIVEGCIHKTECGLVHPGLVDAGAVRRAISSMSQSAQTTSPSRR